MMRYFNILFYIIFVGLIGSILANPEPERPEWDSGFDGDRAKLHV